MRTRTIAIIATAVIGAFQATASSAFGTRSSTVIILEADRELLFVEQNYGAKGAREGTPARFSL